MSVFPENIDFNYAGQMKKEILSLFSDGSPVTINLKNIERASLACVQVLVAAKQKAEKEDIKLNIVVSEKLKTILDDLGLSEITELQEAN